MTLGAIPGTEQILWDQYRLGNLDSVKVIAASLPDSSGAAVFCDGLFEPDGMKAQIFYRRVEKNYPKSSAYPYALHRLKLYYAGFDQKLTDQYDKVLKQKFPDFKPRDGGWTESSAPPKQTAPVAAVATPNSSPTEQQFGGQVWSIQVGAFKSRKSAEATGRQVARFGKVVYADRMVEGKKLIAVQVGRFPTKIDAEKTATQIAGSTGLSTTIVKASQ